MFKMNMMRKNKTESILLLFLILMLSPLAGTAGVIVNLIGNGNVDSCSNLGGGCLYSPKLILCRKLRIEKIYLQL